MKFTVNTDILKKHNLSLGEFLVLLIGYFDLDFKDCQDSIIGKLLADKNLFKDIGIVLSNNSKDLIAQILMESDEKAISSGIDFESLALSLQECYPDGNKPGTTYSWRGNTAEIAQKLRTLVVKYGFTFTEGEAIDATKEYIQSTEKDIKHRHQLKYFLLWTSGDTVDSMFMTIIEAHRENN